MSDESELLKKRFRELAQKSYDGGYFTFTSFLGLAEQTAFFESKKELSFNEYRLFGGAEGAERVMARFGAPSELGYEQPFPIVGILITPRSPKFAERLTHRDYLGALLNLGIEREFLGDIVVRDGGALLFAEERIADFIIGELARVRRTDVTVKAVELPCKSADKEEQAAREARSAENGESEAAGESTAADAFKESSKDNACGGRGRGAASSGGLQYGSAEASVEAILGGGPLYRTEERTVQASSERLDSLIAKVFHLSREDAQALFKKRLVFVSGVMMENTSRTPKEGEIISVRGIGRLRYRGVSSLSKKGKLNITVDLFV